MIKINFRKLWLIDVYGLGICGMLSVGFILFVLMPALDRRDLADARRAQLTEAKTKAASISVQVSQSTRDLAAVRQTLAASPLKLEASDHLNNRLSDLSAFCASCGLDIQDMSPGAATPGAGYDTVRISLAGHGTYRTCMLFLHRAHERFGDLAVNSFRLSGNPDDPTVPLSAQFEIHWFAKPDSVASGQ